MNVAKCKEFTMKIAQIQAAECRIPLPKPIKLGPVEIKTRDFVVLRLVSDAGIVGEAVGYPRGTPLLDAIERIAPKFLNTSLSHRVQTLEAVLGSSVNGRPAMIRATSLFDIALHDMMARNCGLPLHHMLGAVRDTVPVMAVAGYYLQDRGIADVAREVAELSDQGFARIKIMLSGADPEFDLAFVKACSASAPGKLCADAHWSWQTLPEAMRTCRAIDDAGLIFLEDPFGAYQNHLIPRLQSELKTPLTCGEDMPDAASLLALADHVSMLRVDATTCGGISAATTVISAAALKGVSTLPHVFAPVHAQLAGSFSTIEVIEIIPDQTADPLHLLLRRQLKIIDGILHIDQTPGAGFELDWESVEHNCARAINLREEN
jgi:L-alanine-DL-glutamate epimerase-like enolase superfamily enzyme